MGFQPFLPAVNVIMCTPLKADEERMLHDSLKRMLFKKMNLITSKQTDEDLLVQICELEKVLEASTFFYFCS